MNRRDAVIALGAGALLVKTVCGAEGATPRKPPPFDLLIQPTTDLLVKGQTCLSHCIYLLGEGQKEVATVARTVNELLTLCSATQSLAVQHGRQLAGLVPLAMAAAESCEIECRKHAQHEQIKQCADACAVLIKTGAQFLSEFAEFQKSVG